MTSNMVLVGDTFIGGLTLTLFKTDETLIQGADIAFCNLEPVRCDSKHIDHMIETIDLAWTVFDSGVRARRVYFMNQQIIRIPTMGYMPWFVVWKSWKP